MVIISAQVAPAPLSIQRGHSRSPNAIAIQPRTHGAPPPLSSRPSFIDALILSKKAVLRRSAASEAASAMRMVLRNVAASCICAWITNGLFSLGNPFALTSSREQSTASLIMANLIWTNLVYCGIMLLTHTTMLRPLRFLSNPDTSPTLWFCIKVLARATYAYYITSLVLNVCLGLLVGRVLPSSVHKFKCEFYIATLINHNYMTGIGIATRSIFKTRTYQGQEWTHRQEQQHKLPQLLRPRRSRKSTRARQYWKAFTTGSSKLIPMFLLGGAYIQVVSQSHLFNHGLKTFTFVAISTATKVLVQAAIKMYVIKHRVKDIRTMCALVGLPTVLIDTQVRIILLCEQNYTFAATGVLAMAVIEILIRGSKAAWLSMELQRKQSTIRNLSLTAMQARGPHANFAAAKNNSIQPPEMAIQRDFDQLRRLTNRFHAAEASADMHAGYIAIGCSASIWFFYSKNQHYDLGSRKSDNDGAFVPLLLIQIGVEIVADYLSCVLEAAAGVDFKALDKVGSFLALIFMNHAVLNVVISVVLYLK